MSVWLDDDGVIPEQVAIDRREQRYKMSDGTISTQPGERVVLMSEPLFLEFIKLREQQTGKKHTVEWGEKHVRSYLPYFEPTIYEEDPHPDPLAVGQED